MSQVALQRQWRIIEHLHGKRYGVPVRALLSEVGISRPTLYRDLKVLLEAGFPIVAEKRNGEARYRLLGDPMPSVQLTRRQVSALRLARSMLAPLHGTKLLREFDALLKGKPSSSTPQPKILSASDPHLPTAPSVVSCIETALTSQRRLAFLYSGTHGAATQRTVDPLSIVVLDGGLYLNAFDVDKQAIRTFKLARMSAPTVLKEVAGVHTNFDESALFANAAKIWDGPPVEVIVRISPRGARFVREWPLVPSQEVVPSSDGSVLVKARVNGTVEAMRWVLRWGKDAVVVAPDDLKTTVLNELSAALGAYAKQVVSRS